MRTGRPSTRVDVECTACGTTISKHPSDLARNKTGRFFCSKECRNRIGSKPKTGRWGECAECGKEVWFQPWQEKRARFCSRECATKAQETVGTEERVCVSCGRTFVFRLRNKGTGKFCTAACMHRYRAEQSVGKTKINPQGYVMVRQPDHPAAYGRGWVLQHRLIMEQILGRYLLHEENVHHINGVRDDNRPENLELWNTSQPSGQRVADKVRWATDILRLYTPEMLVP